MLPVAGQAQNQPAPSVGLEEIIVTATRREESVRDIPVSVAAYGQEQMDVQGMRNVDDIAKFTPGVQFTRGGGFGSDLGSQVSIRGVSSGVGGSTVGIYIDDTPIQARSTIASGNFSSNAYPRLFDVQRVEVLRGPQGTLFGSGSQGGTIRFITPEPSRDTWSSYARTEVGFTQYGAPSYEAGIAGGGPIVQDKLGFRASVWNRHDGGYVDRRSYYTNDLTSENANTLDTTSARLAVSYAPIDNLVITPSVYWQESKARGTSSFFIDSDPVRANDAYALGHTFGNVADGNYVDPRNLLQRGDETMFLPALKIDWSFSKMELISNTSYYERKTDSVTDMGFLDFGTWTSIFSGGQNVIYFPDDPTWLAPGQDTQRNYFFNQEVRLQSTDPDARLKWVVGGFYSRTKLFTSRQVVNPHVGDILSDAFGGMCAPADCIFAVFGVYQGDNGVIFGGDTTVEEYQRAVFGQADFAITDNLTATLGLRYSDMFFRFGNIVDGPVNGPPIPRADPPGRAENNATTPKLALAYKTDGGDLFYASAAKGFRNGGSNPPLSGTACMASLANLGLSSSPTQYGPDEVWSYELGTKFSLANNRLAVDLSVYQINWDDIIRNVSLDDCPLAFTTNLGKAESKGVDLAVAFQASDNLLLTANLGYGDVKSSETIPAKDADGNLVYDSQGRQRLYTRKGASLFGSATTGNFAAQYSFNMFENNSYARMDFSYQGKPRKGDDWDPESASYAGANDLFEPVAIKEANLRVGTNINSWDVSLFVNNFTNEQPLLGKSRIGSDAPFLSATTLRPRTIGLTATYRY